MKQNELEFEYENIKEMINEMRDKKDSNIKEVALLNDEITRLTEDIIEAQNYEKLVGFINRKYIDEWMERSVEVFVIYVLMNFGVEMSKYIIDIHEYLMSMSNVVGGFTLALESIISFGLYVCYRCDTRELRKKLKSYMKNTLLIEEKRKNIEQKQQELEFLIAHEKSLQSIQEELLSYFKTDDCYEVVTLEKSNDLVRRLEKK